MHIRTENNDGTSTVRVPNKMPSSADSEARFKFVAEQSRQDRRSAVDYPDGRLAIRYRGLDLPYTTFDKLRQVSQATIVENKHLGAVLSHIRERQLERAETRSRSAPRRRGQIGHMFKVG